MRGSPGLQLALEQDVADHPPLAGDGVEVEDARAGQLDARPVAVEAAEELVAAADREQRRRRLPTASSSSAALRRDVRRNERLLAVLAAADVEEIVLSGPQRIAHPDRPHLELDPAPGGAPGQNGHVAAVGVDVQVVRVEVADDDLHERPPTASAEVVSQYGRTSPRSAATRRSASIAV